MVYPSEFYFLTDQHTQTYTVTDTGSISLERAFALNPECWHGLRPKKQSKPRKLIFIEPTAQNWNGDEIIRYSKLLEQLIHSGFSVYLGQKNQTWQLQLLTPSTISFLIDSDVREAMWPTTLDELAGPALQMNLSRRELFIIDSYWLNTIDPETTSWPRQLYLSDYWNLPERKCDLWIEHMKQVTPPVGEVRIAPEITSVSCIKSEHPLGAFGSEKMLNGPRYTCAFFRSERFKRVSTFAQETEVISGAILI